MTYDITLWDFVAIARRRWQWIVVGIAGTIALAIVGSLWVSPRYRSEALLLVRLGRENLGVEPIAGLMDKSGVNMMDTRENEVNSMANVLRSRHLAEQVIDRLTPATFLDDTDSPVDTFLIWCGQRLFPYYGLSPQDQAAYVLQNKLRIKAMDKSSVIRVSFDAKDPAKAQAIVHAIVEAYLAHHSQIHRTTGSLTFLESERNSARTNLLEQESRLRDLKSKTGVIAPIEQRAALVGRISTLKSDRMQATANQLAIDRELKTLQDTLQGMPETEVASQVTGAGNSAVDSIRAKVFDLQTELNGLLSKYTEGHIKVKQLREAIASAEAILKVEEQGRRQTTQGRSRSFDETSLLVIRKQAERDSLTKRIESLSQMIAAEERALDELSAVELQIDQLNREIAMSNANFQKYATDVERARIDTELEMKSMTNVSVAQAATLNRMPVFPIVSLNIAMGFVLGTFIGGLLALWAEWRFVDGHSPSPALTMPRAAERSFPEGAPTRPELEPELAIRHPR